MVLILLHYSLDFISAELTNTGALEVNVDVEFFMHSKGAGTLIERLQGIALKWQPKKL